MHFTSFDGTKISYRYRQQSDVCLVFIHGLAANWTIWKRQLAFFRKQGYSTLTLDLRGHGSSDKPADKEKYVLGRFAKDVHLLMRKHDLKKVVLVGHSMGGMIALLTATLTKRVKAVVLCSTTYTNVLEGRKVRKYSPFLIKAIDTFYGVLPQHRKGLDVDFTKLKSRTDYARLMRRLSDIDIRATVAAFESMLYYDAKTILHELRIPILILHGEDDAVISKRMAQDMYGSIPHAELVLLPKEGHMVTVTSARTVNRLLMTFLKKHALVH